MNTTPKLERNVGTNCWTQRRTPKLDITPKSLIGRNTSKLDTTPKSVIGHILEKQKLTLHESKIGQPKLCAIELHQIERKFSKRKLSRLPKINDDEPLSGLDKAVFWTEYVIRHNGTKHLRSPVLDIPFYQYYLLDVIGVFVVVFILVFMEKLRGTEEELAKQIDRKSESKDGKSLWSLQKGKLEIHHRNRVEKRRNTDKDSSIYADLNNAARQPSERPTTRDDIEEAIENNTNITSSVTQLEKSS
ncbi:hypothetical protein FQR65_LT01572 [Abscondita terminalis]|nr:hypothetical protein FQR65_LT01572 [Abscondita terminalis]